MTTKTKPIELVHCKGCAYFNDSKVGAYNDGGEEWIPDYYKCLHNTQYKDTGTSIEPSQEVALESYCQEKNKNKDCPFYISKELHKLESGHYSSQIEIIKEIIRDNAESKRDGRQSIDEMEEEIGTLREKIRIIAFDVEKITKKNPIPYKTICATIIFTILGVLFTIWGTLNIHTDWLSR